MHSRFLAPKRIANSFMGNEFANCSHSYALFISLFSWFFEPRHLRLPLWLFEPRHPRPSLLQTSRRGYRNSDLVPVVLRAAPFSRLHLRITASVPLVQSSFQGSSSPPVTFRIVRSLTPALPNVPVVVPGSVRSLTPAFTRSILPHANYDNYFLEPLVNAIVQTEAQMHFSTQSPFSERLARSLVRYPTEGIDLFLHHLSYPRHLRTLRSILQAKLAPSLLRELASRTPTLVNRLRAGTERNIAIPVLNLFDDLGNLIPSWIVKNGYAIDAVVDLWHSDLPSEEGLPGQVPDINHKYFLMLAIFIKALKQSPRIDLLFEITLLTASPDRRQFTMNTSTRFQFSRPSLNYNFPNNDDDYAYCTGRTSIL
ncbi:hypothetical protein GALMADRAFT_148845 [Galerina marginata CBS 339.88]|uniref:Uncharacterized protein n=1 Tax=Galerina marginata (strain CBS 339.88) TaxID=685588 RepID=A0A067S383_GALM3|nr:hypothetical protein GALMADRAFT_148845 [Galerina marginata CBS 339.88]